jgi:hypothetical protein
MRLPLRTTNAVVTVLPGTQRIQQSINMIIIHSIATLTLGLQRHTTHFAVENVMCPIARPRIPKRIALKRRAEGRLSRA